MWGTDVVTSVLCVTPLVDATSTVVDSKVVEGFDVAVVARLLTVEVSLSSTTLLVLVTTVVLIVKCSEEFNEGALVEFTKTSRLVCVEVLCKFFCPFPVVSAVKASDRQKVSIKNTVSMTSKTLALG